jgi:glycosyltransferase involved in cell wall biosynthesis
MTHELSPIELSPMTPDNGTHFSRVPPLVSTVVPALNAARFITRAIDSALAQGIPESEIIVVDDGSTDDTCHIVESYRHRGVRLVRHARRSGAAAARNTGIAAARGEYVAFLDADDEWLPEKLSRQLAVIRLDPAMTFISCRANLLDETGHDTGDIYRGAAPAEGARAWRTLLAYPCVATPSVLVRREALRAVGGFNRWMPVAEDQDMWIRLALMGPAGHLPDSLVRVHSTPNSLSKSQFREQAGYVLPMVIAYVERNRHLLTAGDVRAILGERYGKLGQLAYASGEYSFGAVTLLRAMAYGHQPVRHLIHLVKASALMRGVKRLAQNLTASGSR